MTALRFGSCHHGEQGVTAVRTDEYQTADLS
jgi:hypothetical protein